MVQFFSHFKPWGLWLCMIMSFTSLPAVAEEAVSNESEIIYRVNLGRSADVKLLLGKGVSPSLSDFKGVPILSLAAARPDKEGLAVMAVLLEGGADVNQKDQEGQNALFYAVRKNNSDAVMLLLMSKIDYYATDNGGNIARTVAHNAGYKEIVELMDKFVNDQSKKGTDQYKALNDQVEAQQAEQQAQAVAAQAATNAAQEEQRKADAAAQAAAAAQEAEKGRALEQKLASKEFAQAKYNLAYEACGFEYWSFCQTNNQTTGLTPEVLEGLIKKHKDSILSLSKVLEQEYAQSRKPITAIITKTKEAIYKQLDDMPSKGYRFQKGVCKVPDMNKRCEKLADLAR